MKIFCVYTPAHEVLLNDWFIPALPHGFDLTSYKLELKGAGDFCSKEFLRCIREKISIIQTSIRENSGDWIIWSDIDILIFDLSLPILEQLIKNADDRLLYFQSETKSNADVNTGFILIRCCEQTERFFAEVGNRLDANVGSNEQPIINTMLKEGIDIPWTYLPISFVARTHGWPPSSNMAIYHANYTLGADGVGQKIKQFRAVYNMRKYGMVAKLYYILARILDKVVQKIQPLS